MLQKIQLILSLESVKNTPSVCEKIKINKRLVIKINFCSLFLKKVVSAEMGKPWEEYKNPANLF